MLPLRNMPGTHCYVPQCINRGNGHVINGPVRAKNSCVSWAVGTFFVTSSPRHEPKLKLNLFFSSWYFGCSTSQLFFLLLEAPVVIFTNWFHSIRVTMRVVMNWCVKCCRLVVNLARFLVRLWRIMVQRETAHNRFGWRFTNQAFAFVGFCRRGFLCNNHQETWRTAKVGEYMWHLHFPPFTLLVSIDRNTRSILLTVTPCYNAPRYKANRL